MSLLKNGLTKKSSISPLFATVLGVMGSGKSGLAGTFGLKTLVIHTAVESHGGASASTVSKELFGQNFVDELDISQGSASADEIWKNLLEVLEDPELPKTYKAVVIDSLTDLQVNVIAKTSEWYDKTRKVGTQTLNGYAIPGVEAEFFNVLINGTLKKLHAKGVHVLMLAAAQLVTSSDNGEELVAKPGLSGNAVPALINRSCPDVLLVNKVRNDEGAMEHRLLFDSRISKESKTPAGVVTKTENFNMRVSHIPSSKLPSSANARLDELMAFRKECFDGAE